MTSCRRPIRTAPDRSSIAGAVDGFHSALTNGDRATAMSWLADDAQILESGHRETRDEYEYGHLAEDIEFAKTVPNTRGALIVRQEGGVAWTTSTARSTGKFHGNDVDAETAEMMVLAKRGDRWQIRAIHWSSHSQRAAH
jgi:ketosteroid isomerase-like protein